MPLGRSVRSHRARKVHHIQFACCSRERVRSRDRRSGERRKAAARQSGSGFAERNMFESIWVVYRIMHLGFFLPPFRVSRAARVACSNTSLTPSFVLAEHSRYLVAPIFLRTSSAWEGKSVYQSCLHPAPSCVLYLRWWCVPVPG